MNIVRSWRRIQEPNASGFGTLCSITNEVNQLRINTGSAKPTVLQLHSKIRNGEKMESVTRTRGDRNSMFRPVKIWAKIVNRILAYIGTGLDTFVNVVCVSGKLQEITASAIRTVIKKTVNKIGTEHLGFTRHDMGTHSIRASFATLLSLQHLDIHTIN